MTAENFYITFYGQRFAKHTLPLGMLRELELFQRLVVIKAVEIFFRKNPERKALPRNFRERVSLAIADIEEGSAATQLQPVFSHDLLIDIEIEEAVNEAARLYHANDNTLSAAVGDPEVGKILRSVGSRLRDTERMVLTKGRKGTELFRFGSSERQELIRKISSDAERSIRSVGRLIAVEIDDGWSTAKLKISSPAFGDFQISVDPDEAKSEYDGKLHEFVEFAVVAEFNHEKRITKVLSVDDISLAQSPADAVVAVEGLRNFEDPDTREVIQDETVNTAKRALLRLPSVASKASIFPGSEGNLLVEFEANDWDLSLEFHNDGLIEFFGYSLVDESDKSEFLINFRGFDSRVSNAVLEREREFW